MTRVMTDVGPRPHAVTVESTQAGFYRLSLRVVDRPGVMVGVCQVFAALNVNIDSLTLETDGPEPDTGEITITVHTDARTCDLVCRKLERLLDVLEVGCA